MIWLKLITLYLPVVIQGVLAMQASLKNVPGETRKQVLLDVLLGGADAGTKIPEEHVQGISKLIDSVVQSLRMNGAEGFTAPPPAPLKVTPVPVPSAGPIGAK